MSFEMALWQVNGQKLTEVSSINLDNEQRLENWIVADSSILGMEIAIIGRQVQTPFGGRIDLLGLDRDANCIVLELKRAKDSTGSGCSTPGLWVMGKRSWLQ